MMSENKINSGKIKISITWRFSEICKLALSENHIGWKLGHDPYYVCIGNCLAQTK